MRTTLTLDEDVASGIEEARKVSGQSFKQVVNELLRTALTMRRDHTPERPFRIETWASELQPGMPESLDNIGEILDMLDGPEAR